MPGFWLPDHAKTGEGVSGAAWKGRQGRVPLAILLLIKLKIKIRFRRVMKSLKMIVGTSLVAQWPRLQVPNAGGPGLIPGWGTRSHMSQLRARMSQLRAHMPQPRPGAAK